MRNFFNSIFFLFFLFALSSSVAAQSEDDAIDYKHFSISLQKHGERDMKRIKLKDEEAHAFDPSAFISKHIEDYHVSIWGTSITDGEVVKYQFDSKQLPEGTSCQVYCEDIMAIEQTALLGVSSEDDKDFEGAIVSTVVTNSGANIAGILPGDLIIFIDEISIHTGCDLKIAIRQYQPGDEVTVTFMRDGKEHSVLATLGYKLNKKMTWVSCCNSVLEGVDAQLPVFQTNATAGLKLFPNPTEGISYINFYSEQEEVVNIIVTDVNGREVFRREVYDFDGTLDEVVDLTKEATGVFFVTVIQGESVYVERLVVAKE